jgi:hypothetical protein
MNILAKVNIMEEVKYGSLLFPVACVVKKQKKL